MRVSARFKQDLNRTVAGKVHNLHGSTGEEEGDCKVKTCIENLNPETFDLGKGNVPTRMLKLSALVTRLVEDPEMLVKFKGKMNSRITSKFASRTQKPDNNNPDLKALDGLFENDTAFEKETITAKNQNIAPSYHAYRTQRNKIM